jgi:hydroxymethylglutaryl-CoA lyase
MIRPIVHEVGLRDGLQMEKEVVPFDIKLNWLKRIAATGVDIIQIGSFVNPEKMPQMADTDKLFDYLNDNWDKPENVTLSGLVLNERGYERAARCNVGLICMGVSASETHSKRNTGMTVDEALNRIVNIAKSAIADGKNIQVSVQSAFGCGFEGAIDEERVFSIVSRYLENGMKKISLADTAGHANPKQVERMFSRILEMEPSAELACHFHNTYGMGLANCLAALKCGVVSYDSAFGGLGGCPFTKLAAGNVCTEDLVHFLQRMGLRLDIDIASLIDIAKSVAQHFNRDLPGFVYKAGGIKY